MLKKLSLFSLVLGLFLLFVVGWPVLQYQIWLVTEYHESVNLLSPTSNQVLGASTLGDFSSGNFGDSVSQKPYEKFTISVPKIKLNNETVIVDSNNFDQQLAHLPGTALPGEKGNVFITGHSSVFLWQLGNKKPIFNNLNTLKKGDEIKVDAFGQNFVYAVQGVKVVNPTDVYVINPPGGDGRYLTLMTCVPPGFNTERLVVLAKLK